MKDGQQVLNMGFLIDIPKWIWWFIYTSVKCQHEEDYPIYPNLGLNKLIPCKNCGKTLVFIQENHLKDLTKDDFLSAGYKQFTTHSWMNSSDYGLQKKFTDEIGIKYFITVYAYDHKLKPYWNEQKYRMPEVSFTPDIQFRRDSTNKVTLDIQLLINRTTTVQEIEDEVYNLWLVIGGDYYELY